MEQKPDPALVIIVRGSAICRHAYIFYTLTAVVQRAELPMLRADDLCCLDMCGCETRSCGVMLNCFGGPVLLDDDQLVSPYEAGTMSCSEKGLSEFVSRLAMLLGATTSPGFGK